MIAKVLLPLFAFISVICADPILGGDFVKNPTKFPFAVKVDVLGTVKKNNRDASLRCVGVIVNPGVVLTAAHCIYEEAVKITKILVTAGSTDLSDINKIKQRLAKAYKVHEKYVETTNNWLKPNVAQPNDIAIIWLRAPLVITEFVQIAKFPTTRISPNGLIGLGIGWGVQDHGYVSDDLKRVTIKAITQKECTNNYRYFISENTFCALALDGKSIPSTGDSGGPFVYNGEVLGLYSFGQQLFLEREDGRKVPSIHPDKPIVYTDTYNFRNWIDLNAKSEAPHKICNFSKKFPRMCALS